MGEICFCRLFTVFNSLFSSVFSSLLGSFAIFLNFIKSKYLAQLCYIGHTTTTIKERFKQHSSIKKHFRISHNRNITGSEMSKNVTIIDSANTKQDLAIIEALHIKEQKPVINIQADDFNRTLKIFK